MDAPGSPRPPRRFRHPVPSAVWPSVEEARRSLLFSPLQFGQRCQLGSRAVVPAMVPWRATLEGEVTPAVIDWYGRFAEGQPGAIVVEATGIRDVPSGPLLRIGHDRYLDGLARLVDEVRRRSGGRTRLFVQIIDFLSIRRRPLPESYFERFLALAPRHREALAALDENPAWLEAPEAALRARLLELGPTGQAAVLSEREVEALQMGARERVTDVHLPQVRELPQVLPELFAAAARRAEQAGFDGVELHYAHAYTMASFLSARNDRSDGYGGSRENRLRLPLEVYRAVRAAVDGGFVVGCRMLSDEVIAGGSSVEDAAFFAVGLGQAGIDYLSLSRGGKFEDAKQPRVGHAAYPYTGPSGHACMPTVYIEGQAPFGRNLGGARAVRQALRAAGLATPVAAAGGINSFELAERLLREGDADLVAAARQSLADPDWWQKMRLGRGAEVRRCLYTNYCEGLDQEHKAVTCQLWDRAPDGPGETAVARTADGKRRLVAPPWSGGGSPR